MSDDVKPALSAEEWARKEFAWEYWANVHLHGDGDLTIHDANKTATLRGRERHALAALALHGQPFGFTREDVIALRALAEAPHCRYSAVVAYEPFRTLGIGADLLRDLAARIAALLPPEL